jgi:hypothetical protein
MADNELFNANEVSNPLETLVGEDKKYKTPEELAKAYLNADAFIENIKRENAEMRSELQTRLTVEEQLKNVAPRQQPLQDQGTNPPVVTDDKPKFSNEDLEQRIRETLQKDREADKITNNLNAVAAKMVEVYGDTNKAKEVMQARANELGVTVKFLESVAAQSPTAFYAQLGLDAAPKSTPNMSRPDVQSGNFTNTGGAKPGTYEFYENLRRTDPKRYFTPATQMKIMQDAQAGTYIPK